MKHPSSCLPEAHLPLPSLMLIIPTYYRPLSESQPSIVTIPDSPTHQEKSVQTTPREDILPVPPQSVTVPTLPNPSMTLQQRDPPDLPTLLQLRDLLWDPKLYTPVITHCDLHSPILNLYKSYHSSMKLEEHLELERVKTPMQSGLIHALYQLDALPFLQNLKKAPQGHGKRTFCVTCYHLGHYKIDSLHFGRVYPNLWRSVRSEVHPPR